MNFRDRLDQFRYSWQRPQIGCIAVRACSLKELRTNLLNLLFAQPPWAARLPGALDRLCVTVEPIVIPTANALTTHA